ncbi:hypothetical protein EVAR_37169_1 [Eumeta japonica]|uniref:Uncharacterized protein n=1 Tax=Eumeta variegata TaxID=151549 RepID=A0A4C1WKK1_EUMVA|nr:hypothetical protein EVAR_37169_1 [Eumeta japonica]
MHALSDHYRARSGDSNSFDLQLGRRRPRLLWEFYRRPGRSGDGESVLRDEQGFGGGAAGAGADQAWSGRAD